MNSTLRLAFAAAAVVAVAVAGMYVLPRYGGGVGGPGGGTPSPSRQALRMTVAGTELNGSALQLTVQLPQGWSTGVAGSTGPFAASSGSFSPSGAAFFVSVVDNTFTDPCAHTQRSPKVGPTVDDAATALGRIPDITTTSPVQTTLVGHAAAYVELTIPASLPCSPDQFYLWQDSLDGDWWVADLNEVIQVWIVEVAGQRIAVATRSWPGTSAATRAELQGILDSIVFDSARTQPSTSPAAS